MNARPHIGHNGGPPLDVEPTKAHGVHIGQKFLLLLRPARHYAFFGGRGSGKSHAVATVLAIMASKWKLRIVCARQFQNSIKDSVKELLEIKITEMGLRAQYKFTDTEIVHLGTGSRFTFIGLDRNPDSAKSLEGADICWVEEARTINERSFEILRPTIRRRGSRIIWTWNPEFREDPVDKFFRGDAGPPPNSIVQWVGIEDNPFFYHTPLVEEAEHMRKGNLKRYKHIWLGEYDEGYDTKVFSNVQIGRVQVPDHIPARYGMDFGFGTDPSVILKCYVIEALKVIYIPRATFARVPLKQLPAIINDVVEPGGYIKADSGQPGTIEYLSSDGFNIEGARKGPGSVKGGINWIQGYTVVIDPDLEEMREEARLYSWQVDKITRKRLNVPVDANNHGWDSLRYACEDAMEDGIDDSGVGGTLRIKGF